VLHGFELRSQLERWDDLSRSDSTAMRANRLHRIVVYSTAHADEFTFQEIQRTVAGAGLDYTADEIRESLARLTLEVIADSNDVAHYKYCIPLFVEFLRAQGLNEARAAAIAEAGVARRRGQQNPDR
jgi:hypothetical protein